ncbi:MAG: Mg-protoporphyrin IX monomethyl ester oxidative cyclase [Gemmatimonadales bacterium]|nr:MAG: Mg-protoporphyrin IX monomethyl ester oxidative cyclase [Gemmatimonadales bacterium]
MDLFPSERTSILLSHPYFLAHDPKQLARMKPYPPLATLIAASVLRNLRYPVCFFDAMLSPGMEEYHGVLATVRPSVVAIVEDTFNFLTKMCTLATREAALEMVREAKDLGCNVLVNGSDATDHPELYLEAGADAIMLGEVEETLPEAIRAITAEGTDGLRRVPGLVLPDGAKQKTAFTARRPHIENLDRLPFPAWDLVDVERYRQAWTAAHGRLSWNMATSRGCPYHCNWCAKPIFGTRYTQRSPENVVAELELLRAEVGPDHIWYADDIFGLTERWIIEFARRVEERDLVIPFTIQSRVNLMKPAVVEALARAGAEQVWMGVESGSQRILDAMDKGSKVQQAREATRLLKAHGIRTGWFVQLGYLGEEWTDILLTRDLIREERPDEIGVSVSYPLPGTVFYDRVKAHLGNKSNWKDSGELAMLFRGTYQTEFYRRVRDLLHREVDQGKISDQDWLELERLESRLRNQSFSSSSK